MTEFDIYTLGSGFYLEKIFNAIRLIIDGGGSFTSILKFASIAAITILAIRAGVNNDLKTAIKWFLGVTVLVGVFLTGRATIHIHDRLPDSYGILQAPRTVQNVPWGLALLGSTTSQVGNFLAEKFDMAFAGVFVNSSYQETGMLFGSKIIEDISKLKIEDPNLKLFISKFYKRCVVPDLRMGHGRTNGYTIKDLAETDDILEFLKEHSSKARMLNEDQEYISCHGAAHNIASSLDQEMNKRKPKLAKGFLSYFFPNSTGLETNQLFESVLMGSYGTFLRNSSKEAKDVLLQNVMINALSDKAASYSKAFGKVTSEETTAASYYSIAQMAQKFVPIYRAVLECILYGIFPLILVLMLTPIGLEVLKNYTFGFIYLQMWQPMYAILFCIAGAWGKYYASGIDSLTLANHARISHINAEISAIAGYMLASIPILSVFITKGMVTSMGNLASSVFYVQQSSAVQNTESAIRGNYQVGTTQIDTHSFNSTTGNKFDDNYSWMSGMKSFSMPSGAINRQFADGHSTIDSSPAISNLAGLAKVDWSKAIGARFDQSISEQQNKAERYSASSVESAASGYSKLLGFDHNHSQSSQDYQSWSSNLSADQRQSVDTAKTLVNRFAENHNISQQDALKVVVAASLGAGERVLGILGFDASVSGSTGASKEEVFNHATELAQDSKFSSALSRVKNLAISQSYQQRSDIANSLLQSTKTDFHQAHSSSYQASQAMDKVSNLQQSKAKYEQNSSNVSQDLSNLFAQEGIKNYGAASFEEIIRSNPQQTNQLLNQFLDRHTMVQHSLQEKDYIEQDRDFAPEVLEATHNRQTQELAQSFTEKTVQQDTRFILSSDLKNHVTEALNNVNYQLTKEQSELEQKSNIVEDKILEKTNNGLFVTMLNKLNIDTKNNSNQTEGEE